MVYATFSDFNARYATKLEEAVVTSHYLPFSSARLDGMLAPYFTVPFSANNITARDLSIDLAYLLILQRSKEPEDYEAFNRAVETRLTALAKGEEAMVTNSGEVLFADNSVEEVWSNTAPFKPVFDLRESFRQRIDPDLLTHEDQR